MSNKSNCPLGFTVSTTKSDGRTWLHLKRSDGASAALSCQTSASNGETIISQVVTGFADTLSRCSVQGVTDEMVERAQEAYRTVGERYNWQHSWPADEAMREILCAALSAPAQRVEEGWKEAKRHAVELEQCSLFVDSAPLAKAMTDAAKYLRNLAASPAPAPHAGVDAEDTRLLNALRDESWDLRCFDIPTGGGDADIGWRVIGHWMAAPRERTIAEVFHDEPRDAIRAALGDRT